jgi:hypothetical protein
VLEHLQCKPGSGIFDFTIISAQIINKNSKKFEKTKK